LTEHVTTSTADQQELIRRELHGIGKAIRRLCVILAVGFGGYGAYFFLVVYQNTAVVHLENKTYGATNFFVDGRMACALLAGEQCDVRVRTFHEHEFIAQTHYRQVPVVMTPVAHLDAFKDDVYEFIACGRENIPAVNCGLFLSEASTATY
jgi:hypothetical protein